MKHLLRSIAAACALALIANAAASASESIPEIKLRNGRFEPAEVTVKAESPFKMRVTNAGKSAIEFESFELHRERVVQPGESITVYMPALNAGTYKFFDDFHRSTAQGAIVAK